MFEHIQIQCNAALLSLYGVSLDALRGEQIFHIYPNPASDELNIQIESNLIGSQFKIINALGQEVKQGELSNLNATIDVSTLPKGSYTMLIGTENYSHPFLVEQSLNEAYLDTVVTLRSFLLSG